MVRLLRLLQTPRVLTNLEAWIGRTFAFVSLAAVANQQCPLEALKALLIAGAGVGLLLDGFRGYQLWRRGPRDGMADEP